jgi:hypothetical protein
MPETREPSVCCTLAALTAGDSITLWSRADTLFGQGDTLCNHAASARDTLPAVHLQIDPHGAVIVGRQEGGETPYLDPSFRPTQFVLNSGERVLRGQDADNCVSRGHFMLRAADGGIVLVNGVPRRGGGIRPPLNGTWLEAPRQRSLAPGEEYLIEKASAASFRLPNGSTIRISAE